MPFITIHPSAALRRLAFSQVGEAIDWPTLALVLAMVSGITILRSQAMPRWNAPAEPRQARKPLPLVLHDLTIMVAGALLVIPVS
jgi:UPF0716 family protein affecting phage T7 exclusion